MGLSTPPAPPHTPVPDPEIENGVIEEARRRQRRQRRIAGALITTAVVAGGLIAGLAGGGGSGSRHGSRFADWPGATPPPPVSHLSQAALRADTIDEARALLRSLHLLVGVTRVDHMRLPVQGMIGASRKVQVHGNTAVAAALWLSPRSMRQTIAYLRTHAPAGATMVSHGYGGSAGQVTAMDVDYTWPLIADRHGIRDLTGQLAVTAFKLSNGRAVLRVFAQATGLQPRTLSEAVPPGTKAVTVRLQTPPNAIGGHRRGPLLRDVITTPAGIQQAVHLVDSIAIKQTSTTRCSARPSTDGTLTVTYSNTANAPALARARVTLPPGWVGGGALAFAPGSNCDPIDFSTDGQPQTPLVGASAFLTSIIKLAGFMPRLLATQPRR